MRCLVLLWVLGGCTPTAPRSPPAASPASSANLQALILRAHNRERAAAGAQPLSWDPLLAAAALNHARQLSANGQLRHSPRETRPGQGENLWMGTSGAFSVQQMVGSWASERSYFRPGVFPAVSRTGNWSAVGHYTQMIWPGTTHIGCAIASGARVDVLVCRQWPIVPEYRRCPGMLGL